MFRALFQPPPWLQACPSLNASSLLHPCPASRQCTPHEVTSDHMTQSTQARARLPAAPVPERGLPALPQPNGSRQGLKAHEKSCLGIGFCPGSQARAPQAALLWLLPCSREAQVTHYSHLTRSRLDSVCPASRALVTLCRETLRRDLAPLKRVSRSDKRVEGAQFLVLLPARAAGRGLTKPLG